MDPLWFFQDFAQRMLRMFFANVYPGWLQWIFPFLANPCCCCWVSQVFQVLLQFRISKWFTNINASGNYNVQLSQEVFTSNLSWILWGTPSPAFSYLIIYKCTEKTPFPSGFENQYEKKVMPLSFSKSLFGEIFDLF